jgi:hypothetical protein
MERKNIIWKQSVNIFLILVIILSKFSKHKKSSTGYFQLRSLHMKKVFIWFLVFASSSAFAVEISTQNNYFWSNTHLNYTKYQAQAAKHIDMQQNECAKFVNRLFKYRFDKLIWGNAWDTQINKQNLSYLTLEWNINPDSYSRKKDFRLNDYKDRVKHFSQLYTSIESKYHPIGIIGFLYRYSSSKHFLTEDLLPQTHVAFLAGRQEFSITNTQNKTTTLKDLLEKTYGNIHEHEINLTEERLGYSLHHILLPGQSLTYQDYLLEQQFQQNIESVSLLSIFLRKHRNNKTTPILRPVSFSRITNKVFQ